MSGLICASCDVPLPQPEPHGYCARCAELIKSLFDAERELREAAVKFAAFEARTPTIH